MTDNFQSQTASTESGRSVLGKILPWTQNRMPAGDLNDIKHESPASETDNEIIPQVRKTTKGNEMEIKTPDPNENNPPGLDRKDREIHGMISEGTRKRVSVLEMWNLIESVGIRREVIEKTFPTDEAVMELYRVVEKRIHYQREQDMILRLKAYIEKLKNQEFEKSNVNKQTGEP